MKTERNIFIFVFLFFLIVTPIYWFMAREWAGTFVLGATGGLGAMAAGYLHLKGHKLVRPEDRKDGEIYEKAGDVAFFPPSSIWPFWCAVVVALIFLGPGIHQPWITLVGLGMGIWALSGLVLQYYRGDYKH